ncbi:MAG TPA: MFS transporter, partial [Pararhizobium sp.]|nr:MFS transporter [Pararhizobium sp.]
VVIAAMTLIGAGCAPLLVSAFFIIAHRYSPARFAVFASWLVAFGNLGNLIGSTPMAAAVDVLGWRASMAALGGLSLAVAVAIFLLVRDPKHHAEEGASAGFGGFIEILKVRALWPILPLLACNYIPTAGIRGLWAGPYLHDVFGASALTIGNVTFFMAVAMIVGSFVYGPLDTLFGTRKWVAFGGNVLCGVFLAVLAASGSLSIIEVTLLFLGIGLTGMTYGMMMAHARAFVPAELTGRGVTLLNFFSIIGAGVIQFAAGPLVEGLVDPAAPAYAYRKLFAFYAVVMAVALGVYLLARDVRPS